MLAEQVSKTVEERGMERLRKDERKWSKAMKIRGERICWGPHPNQKEVNRRDQNTAPNHVKDRWSGDRRAACSMEVAG